LVLDKLRTNLLYDKYCKCEFWLTKVAFFGHVISVGGDSVDPSKVNDVLNWIHPMNALDIHNLLGLTGYYF
jgi:hypothetical protein